MTASANKQLCFDFMNTMPKQLTPSAEYQAYLRSIRDESPLTSDLTGGTNVAQTQRSKDVSTDSKIRRQAGTFTRVDRVQDEAGNWESELHEIPADDFEVIADLANLQIGWINFGGKGVAPDFRMVGLEDDIGDRPSDKHKEGFKLRLKLTNGAGDDVRELASTALGLWKSMDELHSIFEKGAAKNKGKMPLVGVHEVITVEGKTTTYRPDFKILRWVARPSDL